MHGDMMEDGKPEQLIGALSTAMARMVDADVEVQDLTGLDYAGKVDALAVELGLDGTEVA